MTTAAAAEPQDYDRYPTVPFIELWRREQGDVPVRPMHRHRRRQHEDPGGVEHLVDADEELTEQITVPLARMIADDGPTDIYERLSVEPTRHAAPAVRWHEEADGQGEPTVGRRPRRVGRRLAGCLMVAAVLVVVAGALLLGGLLW